MDDRERQRYMKAALKLARKGAGYVAPNPMVGAVIVKDGGVIGQGYHERFGEAHAEINALRDCVEKGHDAVGGVMLVTLEPCCHVGKTGPCTEAIIEAGIGRVEIATLDDFAAVAGKGAARLREKGIEVSVGCCEQEARRLNAGYFKLQRCGESAVTLKWAQSIDGKLAWPEGAGRRWISNERSRRHAHRVRSECGAVLVGVGTVLADDPQLNVRLGGKRPEPLRVVMDSGLRIPWDCQLVRTAGEQPVLICTLEETAVKQKERVDALRGAGCEVVVVGESEGRVDIAEVLRELGGRGVCDVLVEGGPTVLKSFMSTGRVGRVMVYVAPVVIGEGDAIEWDGAAELVDVAVRRFGGDVLIEGWAAGGGGIDAPNCH